MRPMHDDAVVFLFVNISNYTSYHFYWS